MTMPIAHALAPKRSTSSFAFMVRDSGARILWSLYMSASSLAIRWCSGVSIRPLPSLSTMAPPSERIIGIVNDTGIGRRRRAELDAEAPLVGPAGARACPW